VQGVGGIGQQPAVLGSRILRALGPVHGPGVGQREGEVAASSWKPQAVSPFPHRVCPVCAVRVKEC
jgi:hypothetical protein